MILPRHPSINNPAWAGKRFLGYWAILPEYREYYLGGNAEWQAFIDALPDPHDYVDESWAPDERAFVVERLNLGTTFAAWKGYSGCRICHCANGTYALAGVVLVGLAWVEYQEGKRLSLDLRVEEGILCDIKTLVNGALNSGEMFSVYRRRYFEIRLARLELRSTTSLTRVG